MPDVPQTAVVMGDFPGLILQADPHDIPAGAAREQINVVSSAPGRLPVRMGYLEVQFEDDE